MNRCGVRIGRIYIVMYGSDEENPFVPLASRNRPRGITYMGQTAAKISENPPELCKISIDKPFRQ